MFYIKICKTPIMVLFQKGAWLYTALQSKSNDSLARNQLNVSGWIYMSIDGARAIKIQLSMFVKRKTDIIIILSNVTLSRHDIAKTNAHLTLSNNYY